MHSFSVRGKASIMRDQGPGEHSRGKTSPALDQSQRGATVHGEKDREAGGELGDYVQWKLRKESLPM